MSSSLGRVGRASRATLPRTPPPTRITSPVEWVKVDVCRRVLPGADDPQVKNEVATSRGVRRGRGKRFLLRRNLDGERAESIDNMYARLARTG